MFESIIKIIQDEFGVEVRVQKGKSDIYSRLFLSEYGISFGCITFKEKKLFSKKVYGMEPKYLHLMSLISKRIEQIIEVQNEENQIQSIKNVNKLLNIRLNEIEKKMEEVQKQYMTILEAKTVKFQFPSFDQLPSFDQTLYSKRSDFLKSKYQNHGKDWTKGEEQALRSNYVELIKTISAIMGRSPRSIQEKIRHMGLNSEYIEP